MRDLSTSASSASRGELFLDELTKRTINTVL
jgi:hypothetical protein